MLENIQLTIQQLCLRVLSNLERFLLLCLWHICRYQGNDFSAVLTYCVKTMNLRFGICIICAESMLNKVLFKIVFPAKISLWIYIRAWIIQHLIKAGNIKQTWLQDQPLKAFWQADCDLIRKLMLKSHDPVHLWAESSAVCDYKYFFVMMLFKPWEDVRIWSSSHTGHWGSVIIMPVKLITWVWIFCKQNRGLCLSSGISIQIILLSSIYLSKSMKFVEFAVFACSTCKQTPLVSIPSSVMVLRNHCFDLWCGKLWI